MVRQLIRELVRELVRRPEAAGMTAVPQPPLKLEGLYEVELSLLIRLQNPSSFFLDIQNLINFIQDV
jgi:hypothetical protein